MGRPLGGNRCPLTRLMITSFPLNQSPSLRQHLCHEAVPQDRLSPRLLLLPAMGLWWLQHPGAAGTSGKKQEELNSDAPAGEESVFVGPSSFIVTPHSRGLESTVPICPAAPTVPSMAEGWAGAAAAWGMQGQAQSSAAAAPTPHLPPAGYLALLQLKAVPGWQLSASSPALPGAPGAAWPLASPALPRLLPQTRRLGLPSCITPAGHGGAVKLGPGGRDRALVKSKLPENPVLAQTHPCGL